MALLIRGGQVLAGMPAALQRADLLIEADRIAALGPGLTAPAGARVIDAADRIVLPGMGNAHTHAASHLARGRVGSFTLEDLLTYSPATSGFRTPDDEYLSAAIGAIEMLKTGCTGAYDLYIAVPAITDETFAAVVQAYTDVGVRVVLAPAVADVVFYQTVPGLGDLLPPDLRRTVAGHPAGADQGVARPHRASHPAVARQRGGARPCGGGPHDPEPGHRRAAGRLRGPRARVRGRHPHPPGGVQGAGGREPAALGQEHRGPAGRPPRARPRLRGRALGLARRRRSTDAGRRGRGGGPQSRQQPAPGRGHRAGARDARPRASGRPRHRRLDLRRQPEPLRGAPHRLDHQHRALPARDRPLARCRHRLEPGHVGHRAGHGPARRPGRARAGPQGRSRRCSGPTRSSSVPCPTR